MTETNSQLEARGGGSSPASCSASELFNRAFSVPRTPRSPEYKAGVLEHMKYRMKESSECRCPHAEGTAAHDAWWSGVTESWIILEANGADARRPNSDSATSVAERGGGV